MDALAKYFSVAVSVSVEPVEINFKDVVAPDFFSKLSSKFTKYSRIMVYCSGNNPAPGLPTLKRFDLVVESVTPIPGGTFPYDRVHVVPLPGTWTSNAPVNRTWTAPMIKFQGIVEWTTPAVPVGPGVNEVGLGENLLVLLDPLDTILWSQPWPGDEAGGQVVRVVRPAGAPGNSIYIAWAPSYPGGAINTDPAPNQTCKIWIQVWGNLTTP